MIDINHYDDLEAEALKTLPNFIQSAFQPVTFHAANYPTRVATESSLIRFVDTMHENFGTQFYGSGYALSHDEGELVGSVCDKVVELTREKFGRPVRPWISPLDAIEMFRIVAAFADRLNLRQPRVLEIGPGSGYLCSLLNGAGFRYLGMDNTQAFYLWQNRLFEHLAGNGFHEMADGGADNPGAAITHMPWWRFATASEQPAIPVDIVVCDAALGEIALAGLRYILRQTHRMLTEGGRHGVFLFRYPGQRNVSTDRALFREFEQAGFRTIFKRMFFALVPTGSPLDDLAFPADKVTCGNPAVRLMLKLKRNQLHGRFPELLALDSGAPRWNPSGRQGTVTAEQVVPIRAEEAPLDYAFVAATGVATPATITKGK